MSLPAGRAGPRRTGCRRRRASRPLPVPHRPVDLPAASAVSRVRHGASGRSRSNIAGRATGSRPPLRHPRNVLLGLLAAGGPVRGLRRPPARRALSSLRGEATLARAASARARPDRSATRGRGPGARNRSVPIQCRLHHRRQPVRARALRRGGRAPAAPPSPSRRRRPVRGVQRGRARIRGCGVRLRPVQQHPAVRARGPARHGRSRALPQA